MVLRSALPETKSSIKRSVSVREVRVCAIQGGGTTAGVLRRRSFRPERSSGSAALVIVMPGARGSDCGVGRPVVAVPSGLGRSVLGKVAKTSGREGVGDGDRADGWVRGA